MSQLVTDAYSKSVQHVQNKPSAGSIRKFRYFEGFKSSKLAICEPGFGVAIFKYHPEFQPPKLHNNLLYQSESSWNASFVCIWHDMYTIEYSSCESESHHGFNQSLLLIEVYIIWLYINHLQAATTGNCH